MYASLPNFTPENVVISGFEKYLCTRRKYLVTYVRTECFIAGYVSNKN